MEEQAIIVSPSDNVATALVDLKEGTTLSLDAGNGRFTITLANGIPHGHKFSLTSVAAGAAVIKYGEMIGIATSFIRAGDYVHVHNVASARARGDLDGGAQ